MPQLITLIVPPLVLNRPPPFVAVLPLTVTPVSVVVPPSLYRPPPFVAELPLMAQLITLIVPRLVLNRPPPAAAELPLTVTPVSVVVPPSLYRPPPSPVVEPPVMVRPLRAGRHAAIDLEHPAQPAAADRHARRRARDRLRPARVAQLELGRSG